MDESHFTVRMALVRARFAAGFATNLQEIENALPILSGDEGKTVDTVAVVYRRFHDMCGVGRTIGFNEVGRAARVLVDSVLVRPFHGKRGLEVDEIEKLKAGLVTIRIAARADMQSTGTDRSI